MNRKTKSGPDEQRYLARGKNNAVIPASFDPSQFSENEGDIPLPFTADEGDDEDQTMERLDAALRATGGEVISEDDPDDDDADDPGQA